MKSTNITRLLDQRKLPYTAYELPAEKLSAVQAAQYLGVPPDEVYKTIVVIRLTMGKPILALVPGSQEVDLKKLAKVVGEKKVRRSTQREAEQLTGLLVGGISPLALHKHGFQVILDASVHNYPEIYISGGQRGLNIRLSVSDLVDLTNAKIAEISRKTAV